MSRAHEAAKYIEDEAELAAQDGGNDIYLCLERVWELVDIIRAQSSAIDHITAMQTRGFITLGDDANRLISYANGGEK